MGAPSPESGTWDHPIDREGPGQITFGYPSATVIEDDVFLLADPDAEPRRMRSTTEGRVGDTTPIDCDPPWSAHNRKPCE